MPAKATKVLLKEEAFGIIGAAGSGKGAARLLLSLGKAVVLYDDKDKSDDPEIVGLMNEGASAVWGAASDPYVLSGLDALIISPGVPPDHPLRAEARKRGLIQVPEIELAWLQTGASQTIAVTGTKGKTTTTMLIRHLCAAGGLAAVETGNIGYTFCDAVLKSEAEGSPTRGKTVYCVEVSSFQLQDIRDFRPDVAVALNFSPDHLDRHKSMEEYWEAKRQITQNQTEKDVLIVNQDDPECMRIAAASSARLRHFSLLREVAHGAWLDAELLMLAEPGGKPKRLMDMEKLRLRGMHNLANALAAVCAAREMGVERAVIAAALESFKGAPHRLELIGEIGGVEYFNDSKATNLDSVSKALRSFNVPVHLIAGGQDKNLPFEKIRSEVAGRVQHAYLIGEAAQKIADAWKPAVPIAFCGTLQDALEEARKGAKPGEVIILSPGCASFDQFKNAEDRGHQFTAWVRERMEKEIQTS